MEQPTQGKEDDPRAEHDEEGRLALSAEVADHVDVLALPCLVDLRRRGCSAWLRAGLDEWGANNRTIAAVDANGDVEARTSTSTIRRVPKTPRVPETGAAA